uniref:Cytochrome P450 89A2 n=1 Tax=Aegilops tauschii subsp. strangulata TaxID=200361 RepID=A0A453JDS8_AEGTS
FLLPLLALFIALLVRLVAVHHGASKPKIPPGPIAVPLLGSLLLLRNSLVDAEHLLRRLVARHGPVVSLRVGSRLSIFVADRRVAHALLVERGAALADRPYLVINSGCTVSGASYGPAWRLLRRHLVSETLHPSRARLFAPARAWARRVLLDKLREREPGPDGGGVLVMDAFRHAMFFLLALMCFGEKLDEAAVRAVGAAQRDWLMFAARKTSVFAFFPAITKRLFRGRLKTALALRRRQKEIFLPLIDARRERKKQQMQIKPVPTEEDTTLEHSYVDTLLDIKLPGEAESSRALTDDEMVSLCSEFLNAGTDTTSTALEWIMAELTKNPRVQEKLYHEITKAQQQRGDGDDEEVSEEETHGMPYLKAVVLEGLRKHPPGHFVLPHRAAEDMEVGGYLIPKGASVNFMVAEMGRDEREWERPMEFVPERFLPGGDGEGVDVTGSREIRMMPFGVGRRICAGLGVAMLHLEYLVAKLVKEFEWQEVAGDEVDLTEKPEFTVVMAKPLREEEEEHTEEGRG